MVRERVCVKCANARKGVADILHLHAVKGKGVHLALPSMANQIQAQENRAGYSVFFELKDEHP